MDCPHATDCPLFERFRMSSSLRIWQIYFCEGKYEGCERYKLNCKGAPVAPNLLPNGEFLGEGPA